MEIIDALHRRLKPVARVLSRSSGQSNALPRLATQIALIDETYSDVHDHIHDHPLLIPLETPVDGVGHEDQASGFLEPLIGFGSFIVIAALLVATFLFLRRKGLLPQVSPLQWTGRAPGPDETARQLLAERFARGDISSDDFLERASVLNWTPGANDYAPRPVGGR